MDLVKIKIVFPNSKEIKEVLVDKYNPYSLSRYKRMPILYENGYMYSTLYPENMYILSENYTRYIVKGSDKDRLDNIAQKFYGDASLYWVIGYFNNINDPFLIPVGTELHIPQLSSLYASGGVLS